VATRKGSRSRHLSKLASVPSADIAKTADTAKTADSATTAGSAQPVAFAFVNGDGSVEPGLSKGVTSANVTHVAGSGQYCIAGIGFVLRGGQATTSFGGTPATTALLSPNANNATCPDGQSLTYTSGGALGDFAFSLLLYGS
jgi:hypothetical protein